MEGNRCSSRRLRPNVALWASVCALAMAGVQAKGEEPIDFNREIRPILAEKCLTCHSGEEPQGGLKLGSRASALAAADSGLVAIVPGRVEASEAIRRIQSEDADERMPPADAKPLTADEIQKLKRWVTEGAAWSEHWSLAPLSDSKPPQVKDEAWVRNAIDRFILARLAERGMTPAPEADRYTLIKRLFYDLVGLPPTIEETDAFAGDASPDAYDRLVQRLLDSPHFGERWGRHWLDLAHFADSDGFEKDRARPDAHLYRDWVIDAINADMPFDQFTIEQIAGDLLPGASAKQRIATGFLRQTLTNEEGGVDQEEFRVAACFDRTETVGTVWLGLTIGCVRCHQHKYDPLPHEDYYKLFAFFNESEELKTALPLAADNLALLEAKLRPLEEALAARYAELAPPALAWETAQHQRIMAQPDAPLTETPLEVADVHSAAGSSTVFHITKDRVRVELPPPTVSAELIGGSDPQEVPDVASEKNDYFVTLRLPELRLTGIKLHALTDESLLGKGPGLGPDGNFVLTGVKARLVTADGKQQPLELQRIKADYSQQGFSAEQVLDRSRSGRKGWAVGGKTGAAHWIQFRTCGPVIVPAGAMLHVDLQQQFGSRHLLGHFRIAALAGDERGLDIASEPIAAALELYPEKRVASMRQQLFDYFVSEVARDSKVKSLREEIAKLHQQHHAKLVEARTMGMPRLPRTTHLFHRGDFLSPKKQVEPGVPAVLAVFRPRDKRGDRLDLARWLVSKENFLTPRVVGNQVWQHLFGHGLVRTANDFGTRGEPSTHPELLDWLAIRFQNELKWSRKELVRLIVSSATYRQASHFRPEIEAQDPLNTLLFRQNRFRVESEIVRDLTLAVSGLLSPKLGGPSVFPPMPEDLAKLSYANNFSWTTSSGENRHRRGMYTFFKRTIPHPNLMTFDSPDSNVACVRRTVSNTPLQSLTLLNNKIHTEAAQSLASRVLVRRGGAAAQDDDQRLMFALRLCIARPPTPTEVASLRRVLDTARRYYAAHASDAGRLADNMSVDGVHVDEAAAWVATVRVVLNLDEFLTRE